MARSITEICNVGLGMVGADRIANIDTEDSPNARLCQTFYDPSVDEVLCMANWGCAKHTKIVASDATYDSTDFTHKLAYRFLFPANPYCLKVRTINNDLYDWKKEGRAIYTSQSTCEMVYTKRITDVNEFDPLLVEAISTQIAIRLTFPLQQENRLRLELIEYLERVVLPRAKTSDASEGYVDEKGKDTWQSAGGQR
ncbi:hypothetical protein LCGC14_0358490 [marine sediment metagenome]|uniref:Uncharacterized protein n=1 Tax=marine sediment metagenome TaxID=412755 RepID=A0A0F9TEC4_9ZZZZ